MAAIPDYEMLLHAYQGPTPDPVGSALRSYLAVQQNQRQQSSADIEQKMGNLQLQYLPKQEELRLKLLQAQAQNLPIEQSLRNQLLRTQIGSAGTSEQMRQLQINALKQNVLTNDFGNLSQISDPSQKAEYYKNKTLPLAQSLGITKLPDAYDSDNNYLKALEQEGLVNSPMAADARKMNLEYGLQQLKNQGAIQAAQARASSTPDQFTKSDQTQFLKDYTNSQSAAESASTSTIPIVQKALQSMNNTNLVGPIINKAAWATPEGQRLKQLLTNLQLDKVKGFHLGRMTEYEFNIIRDSIGGMSMSKSTLQKALNDLLESSTINLNKASFYNDYYKNGGKSSVEASGLWQKKTLPQGFTGTAQSLIPGKPPINEQTIAQTAINRGMTIDQVKSELQRRGLL